MFTYILILYKAPEGKIIVYGGARSNAGIIFRKVAPDLIVLNTQTTPFEWTIPQVSSNIGEFPSLLAHTANLVGNYMIVAFGNNPFNNFYFDF